MGLIWIFISIGGLIGGYIPALFGQGPISWWSILTGTIGSFFGIWLFSKLDL